MKLNGIKKHKGMIISLLAIGMIISLLAVSVIISKPETDNKVSDLYGMENETDYYYTYNSMYNEYLNPAWSIDPQTYLKALIPFDDYYSYNYTHPLGLGDDDNSTFLIAKVETSNDDGFMLKQIDIDANDNFTLDYIIRYVGSSNLFTGEYSYSYIGLYPASTFDVITSDGYQVVNSTNGQSSLNFTGVQVSCYPTMGYPYMRLNARTAETGFVGTTLSDVYSPAGSLFNALYKISISRYYDAINETYMQSFIIKNLEIDEIVVSNTTAITNPIAYGYFAFWNNPQQVDEGAGSSYHILELKNITETGYKIPDQPEDMPLTGHVFRLGEYIPPTLLQNVTTEFTVDFEPVPIKLQTVSTTFYIPIVAVYNGELLHMVTTNFKVPFEGSTVVEPPKHNIIEMPIDMAIMIYAVFWLVLLFLPAITLNYYMPGVGMIIGVGLMNTVILFVNPLYFWCAIIIYAYLTVIVIKGGV